MKLHRTLTRTSFFVLSVLLAALMLAACGDSGSEKKSSDSDKKASSKKADEGPEDKGDFTVTYEEPSEDNATPIVTAMEEEGIYEEVVKGLNDTIALPKDIEFVFTNEEVGPAYIPDTGQIAMPYSFVQTTYDTLAETGWYEDDESLIMATIETNLFVIFHEAAHALVDQLDLPVVGKEEDGADALATVLSIEGAEYPQMALSAADLFGATAQTENDITAFADEHSMDGQRFFTIRCLVSGSGVEGSEAAFEDVEGAEEREPRCPDEWEQASSSWNKVLEPYLL